MVLNDSSQVRMATPQGAGLQLVLGPRDPPRGLPLSLATTIPAGPSQQCHDFDVDAFDDSPWSGIDARYIVQPLCQLPCSTVAASQASQPTLSNNRPRRRANREGRSQAVAVQSRAEAPDESAPRWPDGPWPEGLTTAMLRNTPNRYTAEELLAEMIDLGFEGAFDFFYLPIDFNTKRNRGFCFVNFVSASRAADFAAAFHGLSLQRYATHKILQVAPALTQGFEANVEQYARKDAQRIQNPWFRPMIFRDLEGVQEHAEEETNGDQSCMNCTVSA